MASRSLPLLIALMLASTSGIAAKDEEFLVYVGIGKVAVPLSVDSHFERAGAGLPKPMKSPRKDTREGRHNAVTFCYQYVKAGQTVMLELFDSDFGLHTARISKASERIAATCPAISVEPRFFVNDVQFGIGDTALPSLSGFSQERMHENVSLTRQWSYRNAVGKCFFRYISIVGVPDEVGLQSIRVQNWDEPGGC